jgi:monoamine oxidase
VTVRRAFGNGTERIRSRAVVVTLPVGVLQAPPGDAAAVRFTPEPGILRRVRTALLAGNACKLVLRFRDSFWDDGVDFLHDPQAAFPTWWTANPWRVPVLTAWAAGPSADAMAGLGEAQLVDRAVQDLARMLRMPRRSVGASVQAWHVHDWRADPFSRGAYSAVAVGGTPVQKALSRPVDRTLFFAGEATDPEETGTVSGALASGARAAGQVLRVLEAD